MPFSLGRMVQKLRREQVAAPPRTMNAVATVAEPIKPVVRQSQTEVVFQQAPLPPPFPSERNGCHDQPLFRLKGLTKIYDTPDGPVRALQNVTADIPRGFNAVVGPSGQGKTTLLNLLGAMDRPTDGEVWFCGEKMEFAKPRAMRAHRAHKAAWVFQDLNNIGHLQIERNVALPLLCCGVAEPQALTAARERLEEVGLEEEHFRRRPHQLSRGQQQRVAVARAFVADAQVILADEPTASLDPANAKLVMRAFRRLSQESNTPVVMVTHDRQLAQQYADFLWECSAKGLYRISKTKANT